MKAAVRKAVPCKAPGEELPKTMGAHFLYQHDLDFCRINLKYTVHYNNTLFWTKLPGKSERKEKFMEIGIVCTCSHSTNLRH
ncbi:hypothetical protein AAY473_014858 [Plecturocebus cupreus]